MLLGHSSHLFSEDLALGVLKQVLLVCSQGPETPRPQFHLVIHWVGFLRVPGEMSYAVSGFSNNMGLGEGAR